MTIGLARARGIRVRVRDAFIHGAARAFSILWLTFGLSLRVIPLAAPFFAAIGATYWLLLREHDINYYLNAQPPAFIAASGIVAVLAFSLLTVVARKLSGWCWFFLWSSSSECVRGAHSRRARGG